jgi:hypothetical protein
MRRRNSPLGVGNMHTKRCKVRHQQQGRRVRHGSYSGRFEQLVNRHRSVSQKNLPSLDSRDHPTCTECLHEEDVGHDGENIMM